MTGRDPTTYQCHCCGYQPRTGTLRPLIDIKDDDEQIPIDWLPRWNPEKGWHRHNDKMWAMFG